jgi:hypothetical protein
VPVRGRPPPSLGERTRFRSLTAAAAGGAPAGRGRAAAPGSAGREGGGSPSPGGGIAGVLDTGQAVHDVRSRSPPCRRDAHRHAEWQPGPPRCEALRRLRRADTTRTGSSLTATGNARPDHRVACVEQYLVTLSGCGDPNGGLRARSRGDYGERSDESISATDRSNRVQIGPKRPPESSVRVLQRRDVTPRHERVAHRPPLRSFGARDVPPTAISAPALDPPEPRGRAVPVRRAARWARRAVAHRAPVRRRRRRPNRSREPRAARRSRSRCRRPHEPHRCRNQ